MMRRHLLCCTLLTVSVMACPIPAAIAQETNVRTQIEAVNAAFEAAAKKGDGATLAAFYTDDAQALVPNAPPIKGRDAIAATFTNPMNLDLTTLEVEDLGDTAYEVGAYSIAGPDGKTVDEGKYVVIWKREDGQWKLHRDIMNSNMPPPSGSPRATEDEVLGFTVFYVKPDKKEAFEQFVEKVLMPAAQAVDPQAAKLVRFWAPTLDQPDLPDSLPWADGLRYALVFDPFVEGAHFDIPSILIEVHGDGKAAQYLQDFSTYVNGYTYTHFTQE